MAKKGFTYDKPGDEQHKILARKKFERKIGEGGKFVIEKFESGVFFVTEYLGYDQATKQHLEGKRFFKSNKKEVAEFLGLTQIII